MAQHEVEQAGDRGHNECPHPRARRLGRVDRQWQRDDARDVGHRDLRHQPEHRAGLPVERRDDRQDERRRRRGQQHRIERDVAGAGEAGEPDGEAGRDDTDAGGAGDAGADPGAQTGITQRHVRTGDEHHQREPQLGQERERRVAGVEQAQAGRAEADPGGQLTDDHRDAESSWQDEQRSEQTGGADQRERREAEHHPGASPKPREGYADRVRTRARAPGRSPDLVGTRLPAGEDRRMATAEDRDALTARVAREGLRRLVVGFDGGPAANDALDLASALAAHAGGELVIVLCDTVHSLADLSFDAALTDATNADGLAEVVRTDLAGRFEGSPVRWRFERREGPAADELAAIAVEEGADLIVVGRSASRFPRSVVGSVTAHLTRHAECPVLVVP